MGHRAFFFEFVTQCAQPKEFFLGPGLLLEPPPHGQRKGIARCGPLQPVSVLPHQHAMALKFTPSGSLGALGTRWRLGERIHRQVQRSVGP